jgi:glycogen phosphorylase
VERLKRILSNPECPVQIIFAGKAHPHDEGGKALIREIVQMSRKAEFRNRIIFLENYDMGIARYMIQGVDVWLNTPRRPKEASGTSGMKVIYNGGLNCSILDGWWAEGYSPDVGWAIGNGEEYDDASAEHQDFIESEALYNILENDLIPTFYERGRDGLPRQWIAKVKASMKRLAPYFTTHRMVQEYTDHYYAPTVQRVHAMTTPDVSKAVEFAKWQAGVQRAWSKVKVLDVQVGDTRVHVGEEVDVTATVQLGELSPSDVRVQLYYGPLNQRGQIGDSGATVDMEPASNGQSDGASGGTYTFQARLAYPTSGDRGVSVRVLPQHEFLPTKFLPGLITWA